MGAGPFPLPDGVVELLSRCRFPGRGEEIECAVSGGADSLALLVLAVAAGCVATAWHVDHGLREGSAREADVVEEAASKLGAAFRSVRVDVDAGPNLEARARAARLAVLPAGNKAHGSGWRCQAYRRSGQGARAFQYHIEHATFQRISGGIVNCAESPRLVGFAALAHLVGVCVAHRSGGLRAAYR